MATKPQANQVVKSPILPLPQSEYVELIPFIENVASGTASKTSDEKTVAAPWPYKLLARPQRNDTKVSIEFKLIGKIPLVDLGKPGLVSHQNRENFLWQHTCFEGFIGLPTEEKYWEFNITPLGGWNFYRFTSYREDMIEDSRVKQIIILHTNDSGQYSVTCDIDFSDIREVKDHWEKGETVLLGLSAVIEMKNGQKTYCALKHCGERPDFHAKKSFSLRL